MRKVTWVNSSIEKKNVVVLVVVKVSITNVPKKHVTYCLKTLTLTRKVKVFHLGRNLFKAERQLLRCRELTLANSLALECFLRPVRNPKLY